MNKTFIVKKNATGWWVVQKEKRPNRVLFRGTKFDAWKEGRRLARGIGGVAFILDKTGKKITGNNYSKEFEDDRKISTKPSI